MSAYTAVAEVVSTPAPAGGDGLKFVMGTCKGSASYDTGGSVIDLSAIFKSTVYGFIANIDNADYRISWVPGTAYASSDGVLFVDDNAGTEASSTDNHATDLATVEWVAWGTDA